MSTIVQGTPAWFAARLGKVTASRVADVIAKTKTGYSTSRENYLVELALERITGVGQEAYTNAAMQWGTDNEPFARAAYEAKTGELVEEVGLVLHPRIEQAGASPDGLVGRDGLIEIKCPNSATHIRTLQNKKPAGHYVTQMMWQMACTERAWCDFISFDPRMPQGLQLFVTRITRDDKVIEHLEKEVTAFLEEVASMVNELNTLKEAA